MFIYLQQKYTKATTKQQDKNKYKYRVHSVTEPSKSFELLEGFPETGRGDLIAIRTTGAYGEVMSSEYNLRDKAKAVYSDEI